MKNKLKGMPGVATTKLPLHLVEVIYRWNRKHEGPGFELLINEIAQQYPLYKLKLPRLTSGIFLTPSR